MLMSATVSPALMLPPSLCVNGFPATKGSHRSMPSQGSSASHSGDAALIG
jgi:hypothetical protein